MSPFFKKKLTPEDCSQSLLQVLSQSLKSIESDLLLRKTDVDIEIIRSELIFLLAFANDYGTAIYLGNSPERDSVLKHFFSFLVKYGAKEGYEAKFMEEMKIKHNRYLAAMEKEAEEITDSIGAEFARFCGYENDIIIISYGQIEFIGALKGLEAMFDNYSVKL
jgi:hypothetical protein